MSNSLFTAIMFVRTDKHSHGKRVQSHGHKRMSQNVPGVFFNKQIAVRLGIEHPYLYIRSQMHVFIQLSITHNKLHENVSSAPRSIHRHATTQEQRKQRLCVPLGRTFLPLHQNIHFICTYTKHVKCIYVSSLSWMFCIATFTVRLLMQKGEISLLTINRVSVFTVLV